MQEYYKRDGNGENKVGVIRQGSLHPIATLHRQRNFLLTS
uniref:Uncharacterized protein n=1 Tax=Cucumis melo TaxID=3656 RepID=A0A9I9EFS3_CUCME